MNFTLKAKQRNSSDQILGYTSGVYDLFHIGHLNLLRNAKAMCDVLVVGVSTDELVMKYKDKVPIVPYVERAEIVRALACVDVVIPQHDVSKVDACKRLKFNRLFVGDDWYQDPKWDKYEAELQSLGASVIYYPYTSGTSSSKINQVLDERIASAQDGKSHHPAKKG